MNAPVTRRALLGATAAVGAAALPIAALASTADLDAELCTSLDRWQETQTAWEATTEPYDAAQARAYAAYPPRPDALQYHFRDQCYDLGVGATGRKPRPSGGFTIYFAPNDVEALRASPSVTRLAIVGDDHRGPAPREPDPKGEARRQEIIGTYDEWERARRAVEDSAGYTAKRDLALAAAASMNAAEEAVKLCQPRTVAGLVRKAAWVADLLSRDACEEDLAEMFVRQVAAFREVVA